MADFLDHLDKVRGDVPVGLIHANDSMDVVGAKKDRHTAIGSGHIGIEPFGVLLAHPTMQQVSPRRRDTRRRGAPSTPSSRRRPLLEVADPPDPCARLPRMTRSAYYWFTDGASPVGSRRTR